MGGDFAPVERVGVGDLLVAGDFFTIVFTTVVPAPPCSESPDVLPLLPPGAGAAIAPRSLVSEEFAPKVAVFSVESVSDIAPAEGIRFCAFLEGDRAH